ncbi:hypothetical protein [Roseovarius sp. 2305UL8-3]|uniref:hypothetical protein n=1 Tax=Roseovarius conchicola TaxID=3121636 RepID=UPI003529309E
MILSLSYYILAIGGIWLGQLLGWHNDIWEFYDFPIQPGSPPAWALVAGLVISAAALASLGVAYIGVWRILSGGPDQDFRQLAQNLKRLGLGLIGFWLGYNVLSGAVQHLIVLHLNNTEGFDFGWDPLDLDILFFIIGTAVLAIGRTMQRAWAAEDEVQHFL